MASRKTWVWILAGGLGASILVLVVVAGAGAYLVTRHIKSDRVSSTDALKAFEIVTGSFKERRPLYELDDTTHPRLARPFTELPTSAAKPANLWLLAWDPDEERLIKVTLPFWMLHFRKEKMEIIGDDRGFDLARLNLDSAELERIGPAIVFDFRNQDGVRVLIWTQ